MVRYAVVHRRPVDVCAHVVLRHVCRYMADAHKALATAAIDEGQLVKLASAPAAAAAKAKGKTQSTLQFVKVGDK